MIDGLSTAKTVAFSGIEAVPIEVQVHVSDGMPAFIISGLPDKAVAESRDRIKSALICIGIAFPAKRIVVNMSPANMLKEGSHYDLPIALALLKAMGFAQLKELDEYISLGELALNGNLIAVPGVLITAIHAVSEGLGIICPEACGTEAACAVDLKIIAAPSLNRILQHFKGERLCVEPSPMEDHRIFASEIIVEKFTEENESFKTEISDKAKKNSSSKKNSEGEHSVWTDMSEIIGNESAKRALEISAAGGHHLLLIGSPGVGKSMLAKALLGILPSMSIREKIEVSMIYSAAGMIKGGLISKRQFREPHHNSSMAAILGGGRDSKPGEISLAHRGVLFWDEITLWPASLLNSLRESLETGYVCVARANAHVQYPAKYQFVAAMNPCPCGRAYEPDVTCSKLPVCMRNYLSRIPGPIMDRFSLIVRVNKTNPWEKRISENSATIRARVEKARALQQKRYQGLQISTNSEAEEGLLKISDEALKLLQQFAVKRNLSNRQYFNCMKVARTIADLAVSGEVLKEHIAEALSYVTNLLA